MSLHALIYKLHGTLLSNIPLVQTSACWKLPTYCSTCPRLENAGWPIFHPCCTQRSSLCPEPSCNSQSLRRPSTPVSSALRDPFHPSLKHSHLVLQLTPLERCHFSDFFLRFLTQKCRGLLLLTDVTKCPSTTRMTSGSNYRQESLRTSISWPLEDLSFVYHLALSVY